MSTPREEVLLSQQQSGGLKPDKTTSQPASAGVGMKSVSPNPERLMVKKPMLPAQTNPTTAQSADPNFMAAYRAKAAETAMYNKQRQLENTTPSGTTRETGLGTMLRPRIGGNGRDAVAMRGLPARPAPAAQAPAAAPPVAAPAGPARAGDPMVNSFGNRVDPGLPNGITAQPPQAQVERKLNYGYVPGYAGPAAVRPNSADVAGGLSRDELTKRLAEVGNDRNAQLSPTLMRAMAEPYVNMLGDKDKAELQREKGGLDLQQTAMQGQAQGALEKQRGLNKAAESEFDQQGSQLLEELRQNAPTEITDAQGNTFLRRGLKAEAVIGPDGKPFKQPMKAGPADNSRLEAAKALAQSLDPAAAAQGSAILQELAGGGAQSGQSPYAEGTRLAGPDGKTYVVKNGQPVLAE